MRNIPPSMSALAMVVVAGCQTEPAPTPIAARKSTFTEAKSPTQSAAAGDYTPATTTSKDVVLAAKHAVSEASRKSGRQYVLTKILSAEQQVVAGVNYRLVLRLMDGDRTQVADVVVWWQAWRPQPYELSSWSLR